MPAWGVGDDPHGLGRAQVKVIALPNPVLPSRVVTLDCAHGPAPFGGQSGARPRSRPGAR